MEQQIISQIPANWEEIANMRLALLDSEYAECLAANIKGDPDAFKGLGAVLKDEGSSSSEHEVDGSDPEDGQPGYQQLDDSAGEGASVESEQEEEQCVDHP